MDRKIKRCGNLKKLIFFKGTYIFNVIFVNILFCIFFNLSIFLSFIGKNKWMRIINITVRKENEVYF